MRLPAGALGQLALMLGVLVVVTLVVLVLGAPDLGAALSFGVFAFAATLVLVVTKA